MSRQIRRSRPLGPPCSMAEQRDRS